MVDSTPRPTDLRLAEAVAFVYGFAPKDEQPRPSDIRVAKAIAQALISAGIGTGGDGGSIPNTDALPEGLTNLYFTSARAQAALAATLQNYAPSNHSHQISNIAGLSSALDAKTPYGHGHGISDVTGLQSALDVKASVVHDHEINDVTGLQSALDNLTAADVSNTDELLEGTTNLYYTNARADARANALIAAQKGIASGLVPLLSDRTISNEFIALALNTIADLLALPKPSVGSQTIYVVKGYYSAFDGGGGLFYWDESDTTSTADGATILNVSGGNASGRWKRDWIGAISPRWFGARGNGTSDDTAPMQACFDRAKAGRYPIYIPAGIYKCNIVSSSGLLVIEGASTAETVLRAQDSNLPILTIRDNLPHAENFYGNAFITSGQIKNITFARPSLDRIGVGLLIDKPINGSQALCLTVSNCVFAWLNIGVYVDGNIGNRFEKCHTRQCNIGIALVHQDAQSTNYSNANCIIDCHIDWSGYAGLYLDDATQINVIGGTIEGGTSAPSGTRKGLGIFARKCRIQLMGLYIEDNGENVAPGAGSLPFPLSLSPVASFSAGLTNIDTAQLWGYFEETIVQMFGSSAYNGVRLLSKSVFCATDCTLQGILSTRQMFVCNPDADSVAVYDNCCFKVLSLRGAFVTRIMPYKEGFMPTATFNKLWGCWCRIRPRKTVLKSARFSNTGAIKVSIPFDTETPIVGSPAINSAIYNCGGIVNYCNRYIFTGIAGSATYTIGSLVTVTPENEQYVVWTLDLRRVGEIPGGASVEIRIEGTNLIADRIILSEFQADVWQTIGCISRFYDGNAALKIIVSAANSTDIVQLELSAFQMVGFQTFDEALDFFNGDLYLSASRISYVEAAKPNVNQLRLILNNTFSNDKDNRALFSTGSNALHLRPYEGNKIALRPFTTWEICEVNSVLSLSTASFTPDAVHDIFLRVDGNGNLILEAIAWTNFNTRATAIVTVDGVPVRSGDGGRRYLGSVYADASKNIVVSPYASGTANSIIGLYNYYNAVPIEVSKNYAANWTYGAATTRAFNNTVNSGFVLLVPIEGRTVKSQLISNVNCPAGVTYNIGISYSQLFNVAPTSSDRPVSNLGASSQGALAHISSHRYDAIGFYGIVPTELGNGTPATVGISNCNMLTLSTTL
jgi:Phage tail repeat like/Pectate lyase superfamily protein